ncbi:MAG: hypothetical protein H6740_13880 [Alphaproteobacteria bacterium]|nr:hypothetical protein [Alphaproteobacteria bacterium]
MKLTRMPVVAPLALVAALGGCGSKDGDIPPHAPPDDSNVSDDTDGQDSPHPGPDDTNGQDSPHPAPDDTADTHQPPHPAPDDTGSSR